MASRKNGEKRHLDYLQGWLQGKGNPTLATASWYKPKDRAWGEWVVDKNCDRQFENMANDALIKHGKDPDSVGRNLTTGEIERNY